MFLFWKFTLHQYNALFDDFLQKHDAGLLFYNLRKSQILLVKVKHVSENTMEILSKPTGITSQDLILYLAFFSLGKIGDLILPVKIKKCDFGPSLVSHTLFLTRGNYASRKSHFYFKFARIYESCFSLDKYSKVSEFDYIQTKGQIWTTDPCTPTVYAPSIRSNQSVVLDLNYCQPLFWLPREYIDKVHSSTSNPTAHHMNFIGLLKQWKTFGRFAKEGDSLYFFPGRHIKDIQQCTLEVDIIQQLHDKRDDPHSVEYWFFSNLCCDSNSCL